MATARNRTALVTRAGLESKSLAGFCDRENYLPILERQAHSVAKRSRVSHDLARVIAGLCFEVSR